AYLCDRFHFYYTLRRFAILRDQARTWPYSRHAQHGYAGAPRGRRSKRKICRALNADKQACTISVYCPALRALLVESVISLVTLSWSGVRLEKVLGRLNRSGAPI